MLQCFAKRQLANTVCGKCFGLGHGGDVLNLGVFRGVRLNLLFVDTYLINPSFSFSPQPERYKREETPFSMKKKLGDKM